jgi:S-methylmethionine-dependent homocysteine/selenocysteine methylase
MRNSFKRVLAGIVTFAVLGVSAVVPAFAADKTDTGTGSVTGNVTINGSISPLTISVTHPINVAYAISPDAETFTSPDIKVTNNTKVAVIATVESMKAASGGSLTFIDVDPSAKAWRSLNLADSKKYIALGISAKASSGWNSGYSTSTHWAVNDSPLQVGTLNQNTSGTLSLTADYGLAFDGAYTANHQLVFQFQLA